MSQSDQERFAAMLAPFVDPDGRPVLPLNDDLLFIKRGLDLRLLEFEEDCRRIQASTNPGYLYAAVSAFLSLYLSYSLCFLVARPAAATAAAFMLVWALSDARVGSAAMVAAADASRRFHGFVVVPFWLFLQKTEKTLQRQLDELSLGYDAMVLEAQGVFRPAPSDEEKEIELTLFYKINLSIHS